MHALIRDDAITQVGQLPRLYNDGERWWDYRDGQHDPSEQGWLEVARTPRPTDDTTAYDWSVELVDGQPVETWTPREWTPEEQAARTANAAYEAQQAVDRAILDTTAALMADAHADGEAWGQPTGAHDAYPLGITVTHGGKTWESLTPANIWQPGVSGWREQVAQGYPAWVQPSGAHDAYKKGDRVSFNGGDYESLIAGSVWSPTAYPAGWRKL